MTSRCGQKLDQVTVKEWQRQWGSPGRAEDRRRQASSFFDRRRERYASGRSGVLEGESRDVGNIGKPCIDERIFAGCTT